MPAAPLEPLSAEEFAALREVSKPLIQRIIPTALRNRLIDLGYIKKVTGGLALTEAGKMRLAAGL